MAGRKKGLILFITLAVFVVLSGNIKNINLNKRALVIGMGIDKVDGEYELTIQTFMAKQISDSSPDTSKALTVSAKGATVDKSVAALNTKTGKTLSFALCYVVIIGEGMKDGGFIEALDFLINKSDTASNAMVLYGGGTAKEIMKIDSPINSSSMILLHEMLADKQAREYCTKTIKDFNSDYYSDSKTSFMPVLTKIQGGQDIENSSGEEEDKEKKDYYQITETAIFKEDKLLLTLDKSETFSYGFLRRDKTKGTFGARPGEKNVTFDTDRKRLRIKYDIKDMTCKIDVKVFLNVSEIIRSGGAAEQNETDRVFLTDEEKRTVAQNIKEGIVLLTAKCKAAGADILYLNDNFYQRYGKKWKAAAESGGYLDKISEKINVSVETV